ncbi:MAG: hypothetical protein QNK27_00190 [Desulfuromusa sp.]|nr:hypothetical protein [Desulfuromusa sp.]
MNVLSKLFVMIFISLIFSGCQPDHEETRAPAESRSIQKMNESPATHEQKKVEEVQQVIKKKITPTSVDLNVSDTFLKQLDENEKDFLAELPPQTEKEALKSRKIKIGGGVLLDSDKEELTDKLDGGKVNISIPLN